MHSERTPNLQGSSRQVIEIKIDLVVIRSLPAGDEADAGPRPPAPRRECAAAAEAARGDHGDGLAGEEQQQRADAVRRGGVGAVDAVGPAVGVRVHVVHLRAGCGGTDVQQLALWLRTESVTNNKSLLHLLSSMADGRWPAPDRIEMVEMDRVRRDESDGIRKRRKEAEGKVLVSCDDARSCGGARRRRRGRRRGRPRRRRRR